MSKSTLIVFGKLPTPGRVKTRLGAEIGYVMAARLYHAFLVDTVERCRPLNVDLRLYLSFAGNEAADDVVPGMKAHRQRGDGLGERMHNAFDDMFQQGADRVVLIGSDHPTLPVECIEEAFLRLKERNTLVIGPSNDGGYYLIGLSQPAPFLFDEMIYSHSGVLDETIVRAKRHGQQVVCLDRWHDVDHREDLDVLISELSDGEVACPHTSSVLLRAGLIENTSFRGGSASVKPYFP